MRPFSQSDEIDERDLWFVVPTDEMPFGDEILVGELARGSLQPCRGSEARNSFRPGERVASW